MAQDESVRRLTIQPGFMTPEDAQKFAVMFDNLVCMHCGHLANKENEMPALGVDVHEKTKLSEKIS